MNNSTGDEIYADLGMWNFSDGVEGNFDNHIRKSVPGYELSQNLVSLLSDPFIKKDSIITDFGCSTGTLTRLLFDRHSKKNPKIIGIDNQSNMIEKARSLSKNYPIDFLVDDLITMKVLQLKAICLLVHETQ